MHTLVVDHARDARAKGRLFSRTYHLWCGLPERPLCWLLGHKPFVYELETTSRTGNVHWIECRRCGRRAEQRNAAAAEQLRAGWAVTWEGVAANTDRRAHWAPAKFEGHVQVHVQRPVPELSIRFHAGGRGSETPFDGHLTVLGSGLYWGVSLGARLAERIAGGRDLKFAIHDGIAFWNVWTKPDHWTRGEFAPWRESSKSVNPLDYLHGGPRRYSYRDVEGPRTLALLTNEGTEHTVELTLQERTLARPRGPRKTSWVVHWTCKSGIPVRNHDWKGDEVYASAVGVPDDSVAAGTWVAAAIDALRTQITRDREHYSWRPREAV